MITNLDALNKPPGHPDWHLPPANMKMVFQGRTPHQLAKQLVNPKTNGNKTLKQLIEHADDGLVKIGWDMGGRTVQKRSSQINESIPPVYRKYQFASYV
ncbi:MAG: hypothetical protein ABR503_09805 [Chitinophagaceae bacterium]